jgi:hypothetical protein
MGVPNWDGEFSCGATFRVRRALEPMAVSIGGSRVRLSADQDAIEVAVQQEHADPFSSCYQTAQRVLDLVAVEKYQFSELQEPLREHCLWFNEKGRVVLRVASTSSLALHVRMSIAAFDPQGRPRTQNPIVVSWHPSHAYFRRSQTTDDLHEAYRNLFLALEALLSDVYPWERGLREGQWLKRALRHVVEGYGVDFSRFVGAPGNDPYQSFLDEQYNARRCALFHAKLSAAPLLPSDASRRLELADATHRIGELYIELARNITGAAFAGGGATTAALGAMAAKFALYEFYVSSSEHFELGAAVCAPVELVQPTPEQPNIWLLKARWDKDRLPQSPLLRAGGISKDEEGGRTESLHSRIDIDTSRIDVLESVVQLELLNSAALRNRYL